MLFKITNGTQAMRHVWSQGRQTLVPPGETKVLDILDNNAIFLRRCEKRGDQFRIEATCSEGATVLEQADIPVPARSYPKRLGWPGPDAMQEPIRDEIEEVRIRELAKQADPGMRKRDSTAPARVARE